MRKSRKSTSVKLSQVLEEKISSIAPLKFMLAYLLLILVFAGIYWRTAADLYAPYARLEPSWQQDAEAVRAIFQKGISHQIYVLHTKKLDDTWYWNQDIRVGKVIADDGGGVRFLFPAQLKWRAGSGMNLLVKSIPLKLNSEDRFEIHPIGGAPHYYWFFQFGDINIKNFIPDSAPKHEEVINMIQTDMRSIEVTSQEDEQISRLLRGLNGDSSSVSGSFLRMLYFSSIVITTVGFGDIVPLTPLARFLVAAEAICGVICAGLFLNAIAWRAANGRQHRQ
jgi:hypothetical protein